MSDSDSIIGHSDYLTDESSRVVVLKDGRTVRKMKRYNRDSDCIPRKLIRARKAGVPLSSISQSSLPDVVYGHAPTTNETHARNVDIPSSHKPLSSYFKDKLKKHLSPASKHQKKRDDSALRNHAAKCTLAKNLPAQPEVATHRSVANPCYRPNPTLPPVEKHNRVHTEVLRPNPLAESRREKNKLCKELNVQGTNTMNRNRNQPIATKGKHLPVSSKESCFDGEGLQENHKISRPKQAVQERKKHGHKPKQLGELDWLEEFEKSLPLQTEIDLPEGKQCNQKSNQSNKLNWVQEMADSLPVQIDGHSHLNHSEVTVQNEHLSNIEPKQTDRPHLNWLQEFQVDKLVQEQTHNVEEPNMSVPETSPSSRNFNSAIDNDDNVDAVVGHDIDSIDDSRENVCVEQNEPITVSDMHGLKRLFTNVRHGSTPPGEKKRTTVNVQFHESLSTAIVDVTGDGGDPDRVLHKAAQQLRTILGAIMEKDAPHEDGLGENQDFPTTSRLDSARSSDRGVPSPPEPNVTDDDKLSGGGSRSQGVGVRVKEDPCVESRESPRRSEDNDDASGWCLSELRADGPSNVCFAGVGMEIHETAGGYLSDTSTLFREPSSAFMNSLDVMPPTPSYLKQELLADDEDSIQPRTRCHEAMAGSLAEPAPQASESVIDVVQHRQRSASDGEDVETGITISRSREEQVENISHDIDVTNAADVDPGEEEAISRTTSPHLRSSLSESDSDTYISSPERIESSRKQQQASGSRSKVNVCSDKNGRDLDRNAANPQYDVHIESDSDSETNVRASKRPVQDGRKQQQASGSSSKVNVCSDKNGRDLDRNAANAQYDVQIESDSDSETNVMASKRPVQHSTNLQQASLRRWVVVDQSSIRNNTHDRNKNAAKARSRTRVEADSDSETSVNVPNETIQRNDAQNKQDSQHHVVEITHPAPRGSLYSEKERRNIVAYIVEHKAYKLLKGKTFWKDMEFDRVCPGRTWQSLKQHFHKSITRCIRKYVTAKELIKFAKGYSMSRRSKKMRGRRANYYTEKENKTLIAYMLRCRRYQYVGGNNVWRRLEEKNILPGRTWQSLRNHYRKVLVHNLSGTGLTQSEAAALRTYCPGPSNT